MGDPLSSLTIDWERVGRLVESAPTAKDIRVHRLELLALDRARRLGRSLPETWLGDERRSAVTALAGRLVVTRVRATWGGRMALIKGPEVATFYPNPAVRTFGDVDLLVDDAQEAQRALLDAGWEEGPFEDLFHDLHHGRPLLLPGTPIAVELHSEIKWPDRAGSPPSTDLLLQEAVPSRTGIDGVLALRPEHHALCLAAHAWGHEPLARARDLLDVAVVCEHADLDEVDALAREWGIHRMWRTTIAAVSSLVAGTDPSLAQRVWARHLVTLRDRTVVETHLMKLFSPFSEVGLGPALAAASSRAASVLVPADGETWSTKLARTRRAVRSAGRRRTEHERDLGRDAFVGSPFRAYYDEFEAQRVAEGGAASSGPYPPDA